MNAGAMDAAVKSGAAVPVADIAGLLAGLSPRTPQAAARLEAALTAMETIRAARYRTVLAPAEHAERLAIELGRPELRMRARLIRADVRRRDGDYVEAGRIAQQVNAWATDHNHRYLLARSHRDLAQFFRHVGDFADGLAHAVQSVAHTDESMPARIRSEHLATLAVALDENGSPEEALRRAQEALDIATAAGDHEMSVRILNNMAYTAYEGGDREQARHLVDQLRAMEHRGDVVLSASIVDTIARIEMMHGRYVEAETTLRPILDDATGDLLTEGNALAGCLLTVAEAQRLRGDIAAAQDTLDRAVRVCEERGLASDRAEIRAEQAELYAATGRFREAYEEYLRFHAETQALQSARSEARARALQAVFETEEARRESIRFRELAERDALTGLYNRRYVDEQLGVLLGEASASGAPLAVALIDLDYFKRVNDTLSHAAGDLVLQQIAALLVAAAADDAVAARLGGEEFLLIMPGTCLEEAVCRGETLRRAIHDHPWRPMTGALPVTASIGVSAVAGGHGTPSALLAQADRNLYAAKRAGRNRVVADPARS